MITIKISSVEVTSYELVDRTIYSLSVVDVFNRKWRFSGNIDNDFQGESESYSDMKQLEEKLQELGYFEPEDFLVSSNEEELYGKRFNSIEEVVYLCSNQTLEPDVDTDIWKLVVCTPGGLHYRHDKEFLNYDQFLKFVTKVKDKGIVNLKYWVCLGDYDYLESTAHMEFEDSDVNSYYESDIQTAREVFGEDAVGMDGQIYLSDGVYVDADSEW